MNEIKENRKLVLGVPIDDWSMEEVLKWCESAIQQQKHRTIITLNAHSHWSAYHDARMMQALESADLIVAEYSMYWAAGRSGKPLKNFILGIELMRELLDIASQKNYRIFLLGSHQTVLEMLFRELNAKYSNLNICGYHHGYFEKKEEKAILSKVSDLKPDILFVALGTPRQEVWIAEHREELRVPIAIGVGGSFDVLAGMKKDTPSWARGRGFEWFYRTIQDPRAYMKRYVTVNSWLVFQVLKENLRR
jgi:N-acetylglucosaminyldiphosphoundecaprenol N-acetyl-beta-D-mannosaminyltransferase